MFTVRQRIVNNSDTASIALSPYGTINRTGTPDILGFYILHEGLVGVLNESLQEIDYSDVLEADFQGIISETPRPAAGSASPTNTGPRRLIPDQSSDRRYELRSAGRGARLLSGLDTSTKTVNMVGPGSTSEITNSLFAGAKVVTQIDQYRRAAWRQTLRQDRRLRLVLLHHQAVVLCPALPERGHRQLRRRDPDPDGYRSSCFSSRSPTSPIKPWRRCASCSRKCWTCANASARTSSASIRK